MIKFPIPIEIWCEICKYLSPLELWKIRTSLNSNFYHAVRLTIHRNLMGLSGQRPKIILKVDQHCTGNQSKFILVPEMTKPTDAFVTFSPHQIGFQGLGKLLSKIIEPLLIDRICLDHPHSCECDRTAPFPRQDFQKLTFFFKTRWTSFKDNLPLQIQKAYTVLFGYLILFNFVDIS